MCNSLISQQRTEHRRMTLRVISRPSGSSYRLPPSRVRVVAWRGREEFTDERARLFRRHARQGPDGDAPFVLPLDLRAPFVSKRIERRGCRTKRKLRVPRFLNFFSFFFDSGPDPLSTRQVCLLGGTRHHHSTKKGGTDP